MPRIVDLPVPIEDHFRWPVDRRLRNDFARGDLFQVTYLGLGVHGFTHIDSRRHMLPDGPTSSDVPLTATIGEAAIVELSDVEPQQAIEGALMAERCAHLRPGDIALLRTGWDQRRALHDPTFWRDAPYLTRAACERLPATGVKAVGVDFPQDYPIRELLDDRQAPMAEFVSHDVLLRNGVILIEYLCNLSALRGPRTQLYALPIRLPEADGAPARVIAIESDE